MRYFVVVAFFLQFCAAESSVLPKSYPRLCPFSTPNYNQCFKESLEQLGPQLLKGVPELGFPKFNPLVVPLIAVNRTVNEMIKMEAFVRDMKVWGFDTTQIEDTKFDIDTKKGEIRLLMSHLKLIFEYDVAGKLFGIDLRHGGYFKGDFSDFDCMIKFSLKEEDRLGVKYYAFSDFNASGKIGDGFIKLTAKDPADTALVNIITNFYNQDPQRTAAAIRPIFDESLTFFFRQFAEYILEKVPAKKLFPE